MSSSMESDRGSLHNAITALNRDDEFVSHSVSKHWDLDSFHFQSRNFTCCGIHLTDLHAVVEHFEVCHVVVADNQQAFGQYQNALASGVNFQMPSPYFNDSIPITAQPQPNYHHAFDPDDMELELDNNSQPSSGRSTPPDTPITTPLSSYANSSFIRAYSQSQPASNCASPLVGSPPVSAFDTVVVPSHSHHIGAPFPSVGRQAPAGVPVPEMFNQYARYSDYSSSMPGAVPSPPSYHEEGSHSNSTSEPGSPNSCVPPALLYSTDNTPASTPASSRLPSPTGSGYITPSPAASNSSSKSDVSTLRASTTLSRPASSLLLSKPFRCPKPNCNKSYKQANGLKYHMTHGSCNYGPPKDLEQVQALLASKRRSSNEDGVEGGVSEGEMREVEREAERRLRPFACGVADCQRRYKNMNGLRYHYQHSGDHGAIGLALLASGQHECLQHAHKGGASRHSTPNSNTSSRAQQEMMQTQQFQQQVSPPQQMAYTQQSHQQQQAAQQFNMHAQQMTSSPLAMSGNYVSGDMYMTR